MNPGLYIHIPYCIKKCSYCSFASYPGRFDSMHSYSEAVAAEAAQYEGVSPDTVFIGGGTPSCLPEGELLRLVEGVSRHIDLSRVTEFSIEANPNSFTREKAREYRECGANRLSLGLQSSSPALLKLLGRLHTPGDFSRAVQNAHDAGFNDINADIMYALPGQSLSDARHTLDFLLSHRLTHISAYSLTLEEGTPLFDAHPVLPDADAAADMLTLITDTLSANNYIRYEISNFALSGHECCHNMKYWRVEDYIGLGVAAHSLFAGKRYYNTSDIDAYISGASRLPEEYDRKSERIMLCLRTREGLPADELPDTDGMRAFIGELTSHGLAVKDGNIRLTDSGMNIQNFILSELFRRM